MAIFRIDLDVPDEDAVRLKASLEDVLLETADQTAEMLGLPHGKVSAALVYDPTEDRGSGVYQGT